MAKKIKMSESKYLSKPPVLTDYNGDMSKRWVITYYLFNIDRQQLQRKRAIIADKTLSQRRKSAKEKLKEIQALIKAGAYTYDNPESVPKTPKETEDISILSVAITKFLAQIKATREPNTYDTYKVQLKRFSNYLRLKPHLFSAIHITQAIAIDFIDYMIERKLSNKSIVTTKGTLFTFFEFIRKREVIAVNPFSEIQNLPIKVGKRVAFSDADVQKIKEFLTITEPDPQFWLYIQFLYYGFFRPDGEARKLKIGDIGEHYIKVKADDAKNNKTQYVQISTGLEAEIQRFNLRSYDPSLYIFSIENQPGIKCPGEKWFYKKHQQMLEKLGLNNRNYSQYSWKDTGVIALYRATKDIKLIQRMCRHGSLEQTDKYLKSLGLFLTDELLSSFPTL